jgi:putative endonuclease
MNTSSQRDGWVYAPYAVLRTINGRARAGAADFLLRTKQQPPAQGAPRGQPVTRPRFDAVWLFRHRALALDRPEHALADEESRSLGPGWSVERYAHRRREASTMASSACVYLLRCTDDSLYCGWTTDVERRLKAHNAGKASRYTSQRRPVQLVYTRQMADRSAAMREEARIKRLSRPEKLTLIRASGCSTGSRA